jgi:hypothetical protein
MFFPHSRRATEFRGASRSLTGSLWMNNGSAHQRQATAPNGYQARLGTGVAPFGNSNFSSDSDKAKLMGGTVEKVYRS